jgi:hypothetical protein
MLHGGKRTSIRRHRPRGELELLHLLAGCLLIWTATNGDTKWVLTTWCKLNYRKKACTVWHCLCSCAAATACTGIRVIDLFSLFFGKFMVVEFWLCKTWKVQLQKMQATPKLILKILWLVCLGVMYISTIEIQLTVLQRYNRIVDATFIFPNSFLFWNCSESLVLSEWSSKTGQHRIPAGSLFNSCWWKI